VIPRFVRMALAGEPLTIQGDGSQYRNYVYVEDLADAHVLALDAAAANQVFNLEGREKVSIRDLVGSIGGALGRPLDVQYLPALAVTSATGRVGTVLAGAGSLVAAMAAGVAARRRMPLLVSGAASVAAVWLLAQSTPGPMSVLLGLLLGVAVGAGLAGIRWRP